MTLPYVQGDLCLWCGTGRLVVPGDDRCRCCIEDGIHPAEARVVTSNPELNATMNRMHRDAIRARSKHRQAMNTNPFYRLFQAVKEQM